MKTRDFMVNENVRTVSEFSEWVKENIQLYRDEAKIKVIAKYINEIVKKTSTFNRACGCLPPMVNLFGYVKTSMCISGGTRWEHIVDQILLTASNRFGYALEFNDRRVAKGLETDVNVTINGIRITMELKTNDGLDTKKWKATIKDTYEKANKTNSYSILGFITNHSHRNYENYVSYLAEHNINNLDVCYGANMFRSSVFVNNFGRDFSEFCAELYTVAFDIIVIKPMTDDCYYFSSASDNMSYYFNTQLAEYNVTTWSSSMIDSLKKEVGKTFKNVNVDNFSNFVKVHLSLISNGDVENLYKVLNICRA